MAEYLYSNIYNVLKSMILDGQMAVGEKMPTEKELSEQYGVSIITSRRAMVELERDGLIKRIKGSGSYVNPHASISGRREETQSRTIGVIFPFNTDDPLSFNCMQGISRYAEINNYHIQILNSESKPLREKQLLYDAYRKGMAGVILYPVDSVSNFGCLYDLYTMGFPIVVIDKQVFGIPYPVVKSDNYNGAYTVTEKLIEAGNERIAFYAYEEVGSLSTLADRYSGYRDALRDHGIETAYSLTISEYQEGYKPGDTTPLHNIWTTVKEEGVTALLSANEGILELLLLEHINLKELHTIACFSNTSLLRYIANINFCVVQDWVTIGEDAMQILHDQISSGKLDSQVIVVPANLKK